MTTAKKIAQMICSNLSAANSGKISWEQFAEVNAATWDLATRGELPVVGSAASRRLLAVKRELTKVGI